MRTPESGAVMMPEPIEQKRTHRDTELRDFEHQLREGWYANIILEGYMRENPWSREHVARDILQNFFDANKQTLDGIEISIEEREEDTMITVHGDQAYPYSRLVSLGSGHKEDPERSAGGKHQGTKDIVVMLLREYGADAVEFRSGEWKLTFYADDAPATLQEAGAEPQRGVFLRLEDAEERLEGNMIRIVTRDKTMARAVPEARNLFYHSDNPDFHHPDIETDAGGMRILEKGKKGNFYLNGQRISFEEKGVWQTLPGFTFWSKKTPHTEGKKMTLSRDRDVVTDLDVRNTFLPFFVESMTKEERELTLFALEPYFVEDENKFRPDLFLGQTFVRRLVAALQRDRARISFHDQYVALDLKEKGIAETLRMRGLIVCIPELADLGMRRASEIFQKVEDEQEVEPTKEERERLELLDGLINNFLRECGGKLDLESKPVRLFRSEHPELGGQYHRQWIWMAQHRVRSVDGIPAIGIAIHELCHKAGNDESASFSYKLTDALEEWTRFLGDHPEKISEFRDAWSAITVEVDTTWKTLRDFEAAAIPMIHEVRSSSVRAGVDAERVMTRYDRAAEHLLDIIEHHFAGQYTPETLQEIWRAIQEHPAVQEDQKQRRAETAFLKKNEREKNALEQELKRIAKTITRIRARLFQFETQRRAFAEGRKVHKRRKQNERMKQELDQQIAHLKQELTEALAREETLKQQYRPDDGAVDRTHRALSRGELFGFQVNLMDINTPTQLFLSWYRLHQAALSPDAHDDEKRHTVDQMRVASMFLREQRDDSSRRYSQELLADALEDALRTAQKHPTELNIRMGQVLYDHLEYFRRAEDPHR